MTRQERFEQIWSDFHAVPAESLVQYRWITQDGYRLPDMAAHYRTFCAALDSVEADQRRAELVQIEQSENVTPILPLADRTEIVLPNEKFDSLTRALEDNQLAYNKRLQDFLNGKGRWS